MKKLSAIVMIFLLSIVNLYAQQWVPFGTLPGSGITALKTNQNGDLFVATASFNYPSGQNAGVYRSLLGSGALIDVTPGGASAFNARAIETEGSTLVWASCWQNPSLNQEALYRSTDNGNNWTRTYQIGTSNNIFSIKADPDNDNVYIGARDGVHKVLTPDWVSPCPTPEWNRDHGPMILRKQTECFLRQRQKAFTEARILVLAGQK